MTNHTYNPEKRQLILLSNTGKPVFSFAGPIAEKVYNRMSFTSGNPVFMSKNQLENKINELNFWLQEPQKRKTR